MTGAIAAVLMAALAVAVAPAEAAVRSSFAIDNQSRGVLRVESDADDAIHVTCVAGFITVERRPG
jgi:hypothetical protein